MNRYKLISGLLFVATFSITPLANADDVAITLLNRMNHALHELSYEGILAYVRGDSLSTLKINHTVVNGVKKEIVVRLNEVGSEVSRELKGFSLASIPKISPTMEQVYSFDVGRTNRIADLPCVIITARPKDRARYLQKYCIDIEYNVVLKYTLINQQHKTVEQFMFTQFNVLSNTQRPSNSLVKKLINKVKPQLGAVPVNSGQDISWGFSNLPTGF